MSKPIAYIVSLKEGIPSFIDREIRGLSDLGWDIHLYATKTGTGVYSPDRPFTSLGFGELFVGNLMTLFRKPIRYLGMLKVGLAKGAFREFVAGAAFVRSMAKRNTTLVHSTFGDRKLYVAYFASKLLDVPMSVMIHSHELSFYVGGDMFEEALDRCGRIFTVCEYNRRVLIEKYPSLREKIEVIRLFVDPGIFRPDSRVKVLTVAKFHEYKGYDVLAKTAGIVKSEKFVFWIVGEGPVDVRGLVAAEGASENVIILGSVNEEVLRILYNECDIFMLPSKTAPSGQKEGLPVSLMEAMSFGKPVVSTKHAGIPELVPSILVEENDPAGLADAIRAYAADPRRRVADGIRNRDIIVRDYSPKNLEKLGEDLASVVANNKS